MTPVQSDKRFFVDLAGNPLNGTVWVGQPDTDPRTNTKLVTFTDAGGTEFAADQPLQVINGRISFNGQPINASVTGAYSLLSFNEAGVQQEYDPNIEPQDESAADFTDTIHIGLLLADIKAYDVAVGDVVQNVGQNVTNDELGAQWLVISNTGTAGNDITLIDFDNGLQGRRIDNQIYSREADQTGTFLLDPPVSVISTTDATSYRSVWTTVNLSAQVPDEASGVILRVNLDVGYPTSTISNEINIAGYLRKTGSGLGLNALTKIGRAYNRTNSNSLLSAAFSADCSVPLDAGTTSQVDIQIIVNDPLGGSNNTTPDLDVVVVGYTINSLDVSA